MGKSFSNTIASLSPKQKAGALLAVLFVLLIPSVVIVQKGGSDTRSRAAGSNEVDIGIDTGSSTQSVGTQFTANIALRKLPTTTREIAISGGQAVIDVPLSVFTINSATCVAPFNGTPFVSIVGSRVTLFCAISLGAQAVDLTSSPTIFGSIVLTVNSNAPLGSTNLTFTGTRATEAGIQGQSPDVSTAGTNATVTILDTIPTPTTSQVPSITTGPSVTSIPPSVTGVPPTLTSVPPTLTSVPPSATAVPPSVTAGPSPTPPFNNDPYLISIGTKDSLTINIGPGDYLRVNFKTKLAEAEHTPDLILRMRVKDELGFIQIPPLTADTCQSPGTGTQDFYIPVKADVNGVYSPSSTAVVTPPVGATLATVESDGWVRLPGLSKDKFYTISLKAPKTRGTKMIEHLKLLADKPAVQNFDWTANLLFPGDLPNPNSGNRQDCTVNSIDLSLMVDRQGKTDKASLDVADVTYDGVVNGNDIAKVVNTLSTKPDDD